jgi:hypothetical protein
VHLLVNEKLWWHQDVRCNDKNLKKMRPSLACSSVFHCSRPQKKVVSDKAVSSLPTDSTLNWPRRPGRGSTERCELPSVFIPTTHRISSRGYSIIIHTVFCFCSYLCTSQLLLFSWSFTLQWHLNVPLASVLNNPIFLSYIIFAIILFKITNNMALFNENVLCFLRGENQILKHRLNKLFFFLVC